MKKSVESDDYNDIKSKTEALTESFYKISQKAYEQAGAQSEQHDQHNGGDDVVDGDYEVVDED